jgi:uncharacterized protein (TIGR02145 family)
MRNCFFIFLFILFALAVDAQTVRNVKATQEGQKIAIAYELVCTKPTEINLFLSEDNGQTWNALRTGVSGDVGVKVTQGNKVIYWDVLQSKEKLVGNAFVFKVRVKEENKEIKSVKIGNQIWMAENLNVDYYRNGDPIPTGLSNAQWESTTQGACAIYNDDDSSEMIYGKLYNWYAVNDARGLCPTGWHVPRDAEWTTLENYLGGEEVAGGKMKSSTGWNAPNIGATNSSGFTGLPGGYRVFIGPYDYFGASGGWWSSTENGSDYAWLRLLYYDSFSVGRSNYNKRVGFNVRCVRD